ncbi:MAG: hypothetical protein JSW55_08800 [Chloroflexota bacterium]|nr:MAG: hypothetical protein JSW55_08800 [Chloroflexota bacterium]
MSVTVIIHITNEDAILGEVEEIPNPSDQFITVRNPSRKDGKDLHYLEDEVTTMMIPWHRINFVEVMPSADELEEVITFVREQ